MNSKEQIHFDLLYQQHLIELKLQGLAPATVDAYSRAVHCQDINVLWLL